jgi:hypothetical protein
VTAPVYKSDSFQYYYQQNLISFVYVVTRHAPYTYAEQNSDHEGTRVKRIITQDVTNMVGPD